MSGQLNHSPAEIVRQLLVDLGLCSDPADDPLSAWPAYVGVEPASPDNCVTVYDTAGSPDGRHMPTGEAVQHHGFQVRVRSATHQKGWGKVQAIRVGLSENVRLEYVEIAATADTPLTGYDVHAVARLSPINALGFETGVTKRCLFTLNAVAALEQL